MEGDARRGHTAASRKVNGLVMREEVVSSSNKKHTYGSSALGHSSAAVPFRTRGPRIVQRQAAPRSPTCMAALQLRTISVSSTLRPPVRYNVQEITLTTSIACLERPSASSCLTRPLSRESPAQPFASPLELAPPQDLWKLTAARSIYRRALKLSLDWSVHRYIWRGQALYIRSLFEAKKDVRDPRLQRVGDVTL